MTLPSIGKPQILVNPRTLTKAGRETGVQNQLVMGAPVAAPQGPT